MTISTAQEGNINKSMKALQDVSFGSVLASRGIHTVTAGEQTANTLDITTTFTAATGFIVQIYRAGVNVTEDSIISLSSGVLTVADGGVTYSVTTGDVVNYMLL